MFSNIVRAARNRASQLARGQSKNSTTDREAGKHVVRRTRQVSTLDAEELRKLSEWKYDWDMMYVA